MLTVRIFFRERLQHVIFISSVITLLVLGTWWLIFLRNNVEEIYQYQLNELLLQGQILANSFQRDGEVGGPQADQFEVRPFDAVTTGFGTTLGPRRPDLILHPKSDVLERLFHSYQMNVIQVFGEGALLMLLILVTMFMLYYIVLVEGRVLRSMENFISTVTHELKTPIAGVKALLQTLSSRSLRETDSRRYIEMGLREAARLQHLVENVLAANRLDRGGMRISSQAVTLRPLLEREIEDKRYLFSASSSAPQLRCDEQVVVNCDPEALRIVVENLLENAYKYTPADARIAIEAEQNGRSVHVRFRDNGIGLEGDEVHRIFERFYRATENGVKTTKGSGLGLYIARSLSRSMGGDLTATSPGRDQGCTFSLKLRSWE